MLKDATYNQIIGELDNYKRTLDENSSQVIYYAGHGYYLPVECTDYWLPRDASHDYTDSGFTTMC